MILELVFKLWLRASIGYLVCPSVCLQHEFLDASLCLWENPSRTKFVMNTGHHCLSSTWNYQHGCSSLSLTLNQALLFNMKSALLFIEHKVNTRAENCVNVILLLPQNIPQSGWEVQFFCKIKQAEFELGLNSGWGS